MGSSVQVCDKEWEKSIELVRVERVERVEKSEVWCRNKRDLQSGM